MIPNFDRAKYDALLAAGLPKGLGTTKHACLMGALNLACGGSLTDAYESPCVMPAAAKFAIRLNDARWSSEAGRANGLRELGLALLGTADLDPVAFARSIANRTIKQILPPMLRSFGLKKEADRCEIEGSHAAAHAAVTALAAARSARADVRLGAAHAAAHAAVTALAAARPARADARLGAAYAAAHAAHAASTAHAAVTAAANATRSDAPLILSAKLATEILTEMRKQ
jgi:hypothetical protein